MRTESIPCNQRWRTMARDLTFNGLRGDLRNATEELREILDKYEEKEDIDEVGTSMIGVILTIGEVYCLAMIQAAQELNEIKHILAERAEQE